MDSLLISATNQLVRLVRLVLSAAHRLVRLVLSADRERRCQH
ncbi:hypothetical protein AB0C07_17470 [Actinoplanes missouriensis]